MNNKIEDIISNIKSIGYYLTSKKDINANVKYREEAENKEYYLTSDITDLKLSDLQFNLDALKELYEMTNSVFKIKICVASSASFEEERQAIEIFLSRQNDKLVNQNIYLVYNVWEKQSLRFNSTYKQEDFNKALVYDSEIFICLIGDNVGKFTKEEFDEAKKKFDANEKPFVFYVYFKEFGSAELAKIAETDGWAKRVTLKNYISKELQQCAGTFKNKDELIRIIEQSLADDIKIVKQKTNTHGS